jgi:putative membrane protein
MFWTDHDPTGWGWVAMTVGMVLFWALLVVGGIALVRALGRPTGEPPASPRTPEELLAERFARGEIDEEEYRSRAAVLAARYESTNGA